MTASSLGNPPPPRSTTAAIVIAWNEAEALRLVIPAIPRHLIDEIIVVDGGSTDGSADIAASLGARVVRQHNRGYGDACHSGASATDAEILVFLDGDYADDPADMETILSPIVRDEVDLVIGTRNGAGSDPNAIPRHQRLGNRLCTVLLRTIYRVPLDDIGSFRAIRADRLRWLDMQQMTYGWPVEMIVKAARAGYRIRGVPIRYRQRIGTSKVGGTLRGSIAAGYRMLAVILSSSRSRISTDSTRDVNAKERA